nr:putative membrane protein [Quercus suber]
MGLSWRPGAQQVLFLLAVLQILVSQPSLVSAVFINFDNCLPESTIQSDPLRLQFTPLYFDAKFDTANPSHNLDITIYGNVSGQQVTGTYPSPDDPQWDDPSVTFGKIANTTGNITTLLTNFKVLNYETWDAADVFCNTLVNGTCPLGPYFTQNASNPYDLPAFSVSHDLGSTYAFSTLAGDIRIISGELSASTLACVTANVVPDLGPRITGLLTWLPAGVLILKGIATLSAAIWSPWGSTDIFKWSSNYGRDEDLLRLVTPGFGDCLQYIQFVALTGAISLQYPGFYQPAVSQVAWSTLLFNESFVSHGSGTQSLADGVYSYNSTYGMTAMSQLIGMSKVEDVWACMAIWLLVIAAAVVVLCQLGFVGRWIYRTTTHTTEEDLRQKNFPFTIGNMIRLLFNYFILPIVAISLYQLVIAGRSPAVVVAMAGVLLAIMILSAAWILRVIFKTKPRTLLFDDMPTVLMYGPLYNTYSDTAAPFALVPVFITFMRGVALGAIQPSGIAQIIVLAICEVILILTLNGFRPFQGQTSMNAYHTFFAVVRLITVLLSIAFVGTLGVAEATKGWIGYVILFLHACVLVFGFFLNAAQTLVEVIARAMGVGGDAQSGAIRGSILNIRMLKKRQDRPTRAPRGSMTSDAAILRDSEAFVGRRSRSISASSQQLLNQVGNGTPSMKRMSEFEAFSSTGDAMTIMGDHDPDGYGYLPAAKGKLSRDQDRSETFYRPPRARRTTLDPLSPGAMSRKGTVSSDFPYRDAPPDGMAGHFRSTSAENGVTPAHFRERQESSENIPRTDYAVREVDQYYRGPQLSSNPSRKLKTGPGDPVGPAAHAQSWFQRVLFGAKTKSKEPSKGFEVVRSSRMPPGMQQQVQDGAPNIETVEMQTSPVMHQEPYVDSPPRLRNGVVSEAVEQRPVSPLGEDPAADFNVDAGRPLSFGFGQATRSPPQVTEQYDAGRGIRPDSEAVPPLLNMSQPEPERARVSDVSQNTTGIPRMSFESGVSPYRRASSQYPESEHEYRLSGPTPVLQPIETVGGIDLPSRFNSRRSLNLDDIAIGNSAGDNDWLRDVDNLHRGNGLVDQGAHQRSHTELGQPFIPARSSLRPISQEYRNNSVAGQPIFGDINSRDSVTMMTNNSSESMSARHSQNQVRHHRAGDSITRNSFGANAAMHASRAEVFGEPPPTEEDENGADVDAVRFIRRA